MSVAQIPSQFPGSAPKPSDMPGSRSRKKRRRWAASGTVRGTIAGRIVVKLEGPMAGVTAVAAIGDQPAALGAFLTKGQHVAGIFDSSAGTIDISSMLTVRQPEDRAVNAEATSAERPVTHDDADAEIARLHKELDKTKGHVRRLRRDLDTARKELRALSESHERSAQNRPSASPSGTAPAPESSCPALFLDPEDQFRFEVEQAWALRIPAAQKADMPLRRWSIGEGFLASVEEIQGVSRAKIVDVVVEVLTGLAATSASRELKPFRATSKPGSPIRTRADGATCWRVRLQASTPSARRLHFWWLPDGSVELSSVRLHDDMRP